MEQYFRTRTSVDDEPDLASNRRANDARLKSRFEHIFAKYGKDFGDVGDEIDLDTGEIVVNNGHLESMRHEVDPGKSVSSQVLQVLGGSAHTKSKDTIPTVGFVVFYRGLGRRRGRKCRSVVWILERKRQHRRGRSSTTQRCTSRARCALVRK
jgi:hypothetical protein